MKPTSVDNLIPAFYRQFTPRCRCTYTAPLTNTGGAWGGGGGGVEEEGVGGCLAVDSSSPKCHLLYLASASSRREDLPASVGHMGKYLQGVGGRDGWRGGVWCFGGVALSEVARFTKC